MRYQTAAPTAAAMTAPIPASIATPGVLVGSATTPVVISAAVVWFSC
ncbi:MAG TPA: hypothetical protein VFZ55_05330 [Nitrososphaera sp.]